MPISLRRYGGMAGLAVLTLVLSLAGCGGGGGNGQGASFVRAFGGDAEASAQALLPTSDGYLMLGTVGDELTLGLLDGNGDRLAPFTRHGIHADFGMGGLGGSSTAQVAISPARGGWIRTEFDYSAASNSYRLVVSRYVAGATPDVAPTRPWRQPHLADFGTTPWHGLRAQLTEGTRLLAVTTQSAAGSWHGVLALVRESAYVGTPVDGGIAQELRSRYRVWRFDFNGALQSITELDEWLGGSRYGSPNPLGVDWALGADGTYLVRLYSDDALDRDERYWRTGSDGAPSPAIPSGLTVSAAAPLGADLLWLEGSRLRRLDRSGSTRVVADLSADVGSGETLLAGSRILCASASACIVTAQTSDRLQLLWDQDGRLLSRMALAGDLPAPDYTVSAAAMTANGDLLLMLQYLDRFALTRIQADLAARTTTDVAPPMSSGIRLALADAGLVVHRGDRVPTVSYLPSAFLPVLNVYDDRLATLYDLTAATAAEDERGAGLRRAVPLANDRSLALMDDGSVMRLSRDHALEKIPAPRGADGDPLFPIDLTAMADGQGYLLGHAFAGWSAHEPDGTLRWSATLRTEAGAHILPLHNMVMANGDTLLMGVDDEGGRGLVLCRVDETGHPRWVRVYDVRVVARDILRTTELADGQVLLAILKADRTGIQLIKVDAAEGRVVLRRDLRPASGGHVPSLLPGFELATAADGRTWLGFTSYRLVWRETAASANGTRVPVPYGERNLALVRLDDQLQPDRLRVYGAGGNETLLDLRAAPDEGLLVAADTDSIGLGTAQRGGWVMRLNADGMVDSGCQALLARMDDLVARQFMGATEPLALPNLLAAVEAGIRLSTIDFHLSQNPASASPPFTPVALEAARMCLAGLGEVPPAVPNAPPVADAGEDQAVSALASVTLDGSGSDRDGSVVAHAWQQLSGPPVVLGGADTPTATFTAPAVAAAQVLTFQLTVTDDAGDTGSDVVAVTVNPPSGPSNQPPVADAGADQTVTARQAVTLAGQGSDSDGAVVAYAWQQLSGPPVALAGAATANGTFTAPAVTSAQVMSFGLTVTDDDGAAGTDTVNVTVQPAPAPGTFTLTVEIDGGPGIAMVRTGEQPTPQLACPIDYAASVRCSTGYAAGRTVLLYGEPSSGMVMDWTGCTPGLDDLERPVCRVTMDSDRTVRVHLRPTFILAVILEGQLNLGAVVFSTGSNPAVYCLSPGAAAGTECLVEVPQGDTLLLDWSNPTGFGVQAWSGCTPERDARNRLVCRLTMDTPRTVTATFGP